MEVKTKEVDKDLAIKHAKRARSILVKWVKAFPADSRLVRDTRSFLEEAKAAYEFLQHKEYSVVASITFEKVINVKAADEDAAHIKAHEILNKDDDTFYMSDHEWAEYEVKEGGNES